MNLQPSIKLRQKEAIVQLQFNQTSANTTFRFGSSETRHIMAWEVLHNHKYYNTGQIRQS
jgi:hypothetical protein